MANNYNFSRGCVAKMKDGTIWASGLQMKVSGVRTRAAGEKEVTEVYGFGFYGRASSVGYLLGDEMFVNKENGLCHVNCTAWDSVKGFVDKLNLHEGDTVRVHGEVRPNVYEKPDGTKRTSINVTIRNIEVDFRKKQDAQTEEAPAQNPFEAAPEAPAAGIEVPEGLDEALPFA